MNCLKEKNSCLALVLGLGLTLVSCDRSIQRPKFSSKFSSSKDKVPGASDVNVDKNPALGLKECAAPAKSNYRLTRTEISNNVAALLKLSDAEKDDLTSSLSVDPSKTGYENDLESLQMTVDQISALSFALDRLLTPARIKAVIGCAEVNDTTTKCVSDSLSKLAKLAFSVKSDNEPSLVAYKTMVAGLTTKGDERLTLALKGIFLSAKFLYGSTDKESFKSHLANTIWLGSGEYNSRSDMAKLDDAAFVKALLDDPKTKRFAESFLMRRLKVDGLTKGIDIKNQRYSLLRSMGEETRLFIWDNFKADRPVSELLTSKSSYINSELAAHYGMASPGEGFVKVDLPKNRQGILTQASVLTATSKPTDSSIIARGLWIVEKVFCQHIPVAPNIPKIDEMAAGNKGKTPREILQIHRENPSCSSCHNIMDPAGYSLENFGPLGQYREKYENGLPVDTRADFSDKTVTNTPNEFFAYVEKRKDEFSNCFSKELLTYVMRRSLTPKDQCAIDAVAYGLTQKEWGMATTLTEILSWYNK